MTRQSRLLLILLALSALPVAGRAQATLPKDSTERVRNWTRLLLANKPDSLWNAVGKPSSNGPFASPTSLGGFITDFLSQSGGIMPQEERWVWRGANRQFWVTVASERISEPAVLRWVVLADGRFGGFGANPLSQAPPVDSGGPVIKVP